MPNPKIAALNNAQGNAAFITSPNFFVHNPAIPNAKGTIVEANPKNNTGG